jgi:hypothetical protein
MIIVTTEDLGFRTKNIKWLLSPLTGPSARLFVNRRGGATQAIFGVHEGSSHRDYEYWRFSIPRSELRGAYYERWEKIDVDQWLLERAYLHIYRFDKHFAEDKEFLCLHCDPGEEPTAAHGFYKRVPHLHIKEANAPIPHAHIALSHKYLSRRRSLENLMKWAAKMIREEVLDAMQT